MIIACPCAKAASCQLHTIVLKDTLLQRPSHLQVLQEPVPLALTESGCLSVGGETLELADLNTLNGDGWLDDDVNVVLYYCLVHDTECLV